MLIGGGGGGGENWNMTLSHTGRLQWYTECVPIWFGWSFPHAWRPPNQQGLWFSNFFTARTVLLARDPLVDGGAETRGVAGVAASPDLKWFPSYTRFTVWFSGFQDPTLYTLFQHPCFLVLLHHFHTFSVVPTLLGYMKKVRKRQ